MNEMTVERSIWIPAPRERVWQAVTDPAQVAQWLMPPALGAQLTRDDDGKVFVNMGPMQAPIALFESFDPPRQVTTRGMPDAVISTTYILEPEADGTRVTVVMQGFDDLPEPAARGRLGPSGLAWEKALENLKASIAGAELPYPQGYVSAMFGYRRDDANKFAVERSIWIKAKRERVWQAITDPQQVKQWFSPGSEWRGTGPVVGGTVSVVDPETGADTYTQVIDLVDPPYQLATRQQDPPHHVTLWTLTDEKGGTRLTLTYSGYELEPEEGRHDNMEQNAFGFGMMLENVKASVEGAELPYPGGF